MIDREEMVVVVEQDEVVLRDERDGGVAQGQLSGQDGLDDPKLKARFAELGSPVLPGSPTAFGRLIAADTEKWAKVVKFAGIKAD